MVKNKKSRARNNLQLYAITKNFRSSRLKMGMLQLCLTEVFCATQKRFALILRNTKDILRDKENLRELKRYDATLRVSQNYRELQKVQKDRTN